MIINKYLTIILRYQFTKITLRSLNNILPTQT